MLITVYYEVSCSYEHSSNLYLKALLIDISLYIWSEICPMEQLPSFHKQFSMSSLFLDTG